MNVKENWEWERCANLFFFLCFKFKLRTHQGLPLSATVKNLIDGATRSWKIDLIKNIFNAENAKAIIVQVPASMQECEDKLKCCYIPNGQFTVKTRVLSTNRIS